MADEKECNGPETVGEYNDWEHPRNLGNRDVGGVVDGAGYVHSDADPGL